ncbi:hypothetical protein EDM80_07805 [bacterium]|nr:MAG: hypothetical protein EDM80_07805 [bacterium]RIK63594.1 MAG: hypothetical protein DCC64_07065 [Planctomycetota bacterium]
MRRVILACLALLSLAFNTQAEAPSFEPIQKKEEVLKLEEEGGKKVLKLAGEQELSVLSLLRAWTEASGNQVMYQPPQVASFIVTIAAPKEGKTYDTDGIEGLLADALWHFRLYLVELSAGRFHVVQATEAMTYAPILDAAKLNTVPQHRVVNLWWRTAFPVLFLYRATAANLMWPEAMHMSRVPGIVLVCDRAGKLRELIPSFEEIERQAALREIRIYESASFIEPANVAKALDELVPKDVFVPQNAVSAIADTRLLLVWAVPEIQALVPGVLAQLAANTSAEPEPAVRRYELPETAVASDVVAALEKLFRDVRQDGPRIVGVPGKRVIVVRADRHEHKQIAEFIDLLK